MQWAIQLLNDHSFLPLTLGDEGDFMRISSSSKKLMSMEWFNFLSSLIRSVKRKRIASYRTTIANLQSRTKILEISHLCHFHVHARKKFGWWRQGCKNPLNTYRAAFLDGKGKTERKILTLNYCPKEFCHPPHVCFKHDVHNG